MIFFIFLKLIFKMKNCFSRVVQQDQVELSVAKRQPPSCSLESLICIWKVANIFLHSQKYHTAIILFFTDKIERKINAIHMRVIKGWNNSSQKLCKKIVVQNFFNQEQEKHREMNRKWKNILQILLLKKYKKYSIWSASEEANQNFQ